MEWECMNPPELFVGSLFRAGSQFAIKISGKPCILNRRGWIDINMFDIYLALKCNLFHTGTKMDAEVKKIAELIHQRMNTAEVILFGSHAYGNPNNDSDLDICVITDSEKSKIDIMREIRHDSIRFLTKPLDLLVYRKDEFKKKSIEINGLERTISEKGIKIYG
jgi:uncharacterized protein